VSVPLFATKPVLEPLLPDVIAAQKAVIEGGRYILGPEVQAFESEFAAYCGVSHCVGVANGTDAITIGLRALGVGPGDEVIAPALTFYASVEAIVNAGATPVLCDVDPDLYVITAETVEPLISEKTKALLPVHLYGNPAPLEEGGELRRLAGEHGLRVLEDAAQAAGARLGGRMAGGLGDAATFSFFPSKNLGGFGDGGCVVTDDEEVAALARRLRFHGSEDKVTHTEIGYNSRLDELQAAALRVLLPHLEDWTARRRAAAAAYEQAGLGEHLTLPAETPGGESCFHLYTARTPDRDGLAAALSGQGIGARAYYTVPMHRQPAVAPYAAGGSLPGAEQAAEQCLALPMGPALAPEDARAVTDAVAAALAGAAK
jgi:dTDP-4-amino-4,6-dideoxygalactose transaminase